MSLALKRLSRRLRPSRPVWRRRPALERVRSPLILLFGPKTMLSHIGACSRESCVAKVVARVSPFDLESIPSRKGRTGHCLLTPLWNMVLSFSRCSLLLFFLASQRKPHEGGSAVLILRIWVRLFGGLALLLWL